jgi:hypothetical protein
MGHFYVNFAVKSRKRRVVEAALRRRNAVASKVRNGWVIVLDEEADSQKSEVIRALAERLSQATRAPVLAALNHDDDVLWLLLYVNGELRDEYDSAPSYFDGGMDVDAAEARPKGGDARLLCRTFKRARRRAAVEAILRAPDGRYVVEVERHTDLGAALGVPAHALGYRALGTHSLEGALDKTDLVAARHRLENTLDPVGVRGQPVVPPRVVDGMLVELPPEPTQYRATRRRSDGYESKSWVDGDWLRLETFLRGRLQYVLIERPDEDRLYAEHGVGRTRIDRLRPILAARRSFDAASPVKSWRPVRAESIDGRDATLFEGYSDETRGALVARPRDRPRAPHGDPELTRRARSARRHTRHRDRPAIGQCLPAGMARAERVLAPAASHSRVTGSRARRRVPTGGAGSDRPECR